MGLAWSHLISGYFQSQPYMTQSHWFPFLHCAFTNHKGPWTLPDGVDSVCVYTCVCVCFCACMCTRLGVCLCGWASVCARVCLSVYICVGLHEHVPVDVCARVCGVCGQMCVCMHLTLSFAPRLLSQHCPLCTWPVDTARTQVLRVAPHTLLRGPPVTVGGSQGQAPRLSFPDSAMGTAGHASCWSLAFVHGPGVQDFRPDGQCFCLSAVASSLACDSLVSGSAISVSLSPSPGPGSPAALTSQELGLPRGRAGRHPGEQRARREGRGLCSGLRPGQGLPPTLSGPPVAHELLRDVTAELHLHRGTSTHGLVPVQG